MNKPLNPSKNRAVRLKPTKPLRLGKEGGQYSRQMENPPTPVPLEKMGFPAVYQCKKGVPFLPGQYDRKAKYKNMVTVKTPCKKDYFQQTATVY